MIRREFQILGASVLFFTRLPVPYKVPYHKEHQYLILTWLPFIGIIVGILGGLAFYGINQYLPQNLAIILTLGFMVLLTGAFHEDGFADICDAFGGGYSKEQVLAIMKDSRVGTYAVVGLILLFACKISTLSALEPHVIMLVIIASQTVSRWPLLLVTKIWSYARNPEQSKSVDTSKPVSVLRIIVALSITTVPLYYFNTWAVFLSIPLLLAVTLFFGIWFNKKINGYTGDCLGAAQQINELVFYIFCLAMQSNNMALI